MRFDIITIFPEMFAGVFSGGVVKKALDKEVVRIAVHDLRDFTTDKHRQVDDRPFGGLEGMVLKPEPIFRAVEAVRGPGRSKVFLLSPQGRPLDAGMARALAAEEQVILICGRYEGVDERVVEHLADGEISIGDYVLSGGELAARGRRRRGGAVRARRRRQGRLGRRTIPSPQGRSIAPSTRGRASSGASRCRPCSSRAITGGSSAGGGRRLWKRRPGRGRT